MDTFGSQSGLHVVDGEGAGGQVSTLIRPDADAANVSRAGAVPEQVLTQFITSCI